MVLRSRRRRAAIFVATVGALSLVAAGCSDDDGGETGATGGGTTVDVTVQEFAVIPASSSAPAGDVTFDVTNKGPDDTHEFVVFKTDLAEDALPVDADGNVDEAGEGVELVDELEDIAPGDSPSLTVTLDAANYVIICNIPGHYAQGMHTTFVVS